MIRHLLHLPSVVSLARQILGIKRPETTLADYAAQVADLQPVTEADFDLPPMRRRGDIAKALAELDAVASVGDIKWEASA